MQITCVDHAAACQVPTSPPCPITGPPRLPQSLLQAWCRSIEKIKNPLNVRSEYRVRHGEDLMKRIVVPDFFDRASTRAHTLDEPVLRLVEHPHVTPGLKQQDRRFDTAARIWRKYGTAELQRLTHPLECGLIGLVRHIVAPQPVEIAFTRLAGTRVFIKIKRHERIEILLAEYRPAPQPQAA